MKQIYLQRTQWWAYCRLMRVDKPIGTLLLLWPTLSALWLAQGGIPPWPILLVFILGVCLMRAAGCVINDYADRQFDGHIERTRNRPLPNGEVSERGSKLLFAILVIASFALVLTLNWLTIALSMVALVLAWVYPFMKRVTHLPQVVLGMAFSWSIPMAFAAVTQHLPLSCWLLLLANVCWTVAYDTQYAMVDRDDDVKIGIKSTAILFGRYDRLIIAALQLVSLVIMAWVGYLNQLTLWFYGAILLAGSMFIYQQKLMLVRERDACLRAFIHNNYVGLILFMGIVAG